MKDEEFFEFVKHDLKGIESDLKGFLEVYYPMLRSSWNPQNESDFIIGWLLGSKEQEYSTAYYHKNNQRLGQELLYRIHQEITHQKQQIQKVVTGYCVKCRTKREMKDPKSITMKNGRPATKGICPTCGTKMFRIGKT